MAEPKIVVRSRSLQATAIPMLVAVLGMWGMSEAEVTLISSTVDKVVGTGLLVFSAIREWQHIRNPQPTKAAKVSPVAAAGLVALLGLGCATNPETGDRQVDRELCLARVEEARAAKLACGLIDDPQNRERCEIGADIGLSAARLGCSFADDVVVATPSEVE